MDGMLTQDEINALLAGMDVSDSTPDAPTDAGGNDDIPPLTDLEKDAIGEVANISMGSSATTLYSLVNRKVNITTPTVSLASWENVIEEYQKPCVFIQIRYTQGLDGSNILILQEHDVKVITNLMMGGDGTTLDDELTELHLSAISEAMNQMMGASATSLSTMLNRLIDISPPEASLIDLPAQEFGEEIADFLAGQFVKISFRMQIDELVDSMILQLYPIDFAKSLCDIFLGGSGAPEAKAEPEPAVSDYTPPTMNEAPVMGAGMQGMPQMDMSQMGMPQTGMPQMSMPQMSMPQMGMPMMGMPQMSMPMMGMPQMGMGQEMNIQPAQFQNFQGNYSGIPGAENIAIIKDVPLEVTVELGRTTKPIADILDFAPGTIIELDKLAGEPVDVLVNGKYVAKGEVVVVEESFGVRVTEIIK